MSRIYISWNENYNFWNQEQRLWSEVYDEEFSAGRNPKEYDQLLKDQFLEEQIRMLREELLINLEKERQKYKNLYNKNKL